MRALTVVVLALTLAVTPGCRRGTELQSRVDVPIRLEGVKRLHAPPAVTVTVERKKDTPTAACGHTALCAVVLAAIVWQRVFPEKWDEATVLDNGRLVYQGRFDTDGALIEAEVRRDGQARMIGVVALEKLGQRLVVEVARAPLRPDGTPGDFTPTPLRPQIDLPAAYRAKMAGERRPAARAELLVELGRSMPAEDALPLLVEVLPRESDEAAARVVEGLCQDLERTKAACHGVLDRLAPAPQGPRTALAGLRAAKSLPGVAPSFARVVIPHFCGAPQPDGFLDRTFDDMRFSDAARAVGAAEGLSESPDVRAQIDQCGIPARRCVFRRGLGQPVSEDELRAGLRDSYTGGLVREGLDLDDPLHQRLLREVDGAEAFQVAMDNRILAGFGMGNPKIPTSQELEVLTRVYLRGGLDATQSQDSTVLYLFHRANAKHDGVPFGVAKPDQTVSVARRTIEGAPDGLTPRLRAALLVLGDRGQARPASRVFDIPPKGGLRHEYGVIHAKSVRYALTLAGCEEDEIRQVEAQAKNVPDDARGDLCTRPLEL